MAQLAATEIVSGLCFLGMDVALLDEQVGVFVDAHGTLHGIPEGSGPGDCERYAVGESEDIVIKLGAALGCALCKCAEFELTAYRQMQHGCILVKAVERLGGRNPGPLVPGVACGPFDLWKDMWKVSWTSAELDVVEFDGTAAFAEPVRRGRERVSNFRQLVLGTLRSSVVIEEIRDLVKRVPVVQALCDDEVDDSQMVAFGVVDYGFLWEKDTPTNVMLNDILVLSYCREEILQGDCCSYVLVAPYDVYHLLGGRMQLSDFVVAEEAINVLEAAARLWEPFSSNELHSFSVAVLATNSCLN